MSASSVETLFQVIGRPFVDLKLFGAHPLGVGAIGGSGRFGSAAVVQLCLQMRHLLTAMELLILAALRAPVTGLTVLQHKQRCEAQRGGEAGDTLRTEETKDHGRLQSASTDAPSRVALTLKRPTGPR